MDGDVGVEEEDQGGCGGLGTEVAGGGGTLWRWGCERRSRPPFVPATAESSVEPSSTTISSKSVSLRVTKPPEAALEVATPVSHGNHDRERRPPRPRARRTGGDIVHDSPSPVRTRHVPECVSILGIARTRAFTARRQDGANDRRSRFEVYGPADPTQHSRDVRRKCSPNRKICQRCPECTNRLTKLSVTTGIKEGLVHPECAGRIALSGRRVPLRSAEIRDWFNSPKSLSLPSVNRTTTL